MSYTSPENIIGSSYCAEAVPIAFQRTDAATVDSYVFEAAQDT